MLTRTKVLDLMIAALLILTLAPGPVTASAPTRAVESLNRLSDSETYFSDFNAPSVSSVAQDSLTLLSTGVTTRVSVKSDGEQGNSTSGSPSISADGRYVAFNSYASNLVSGDTNGECDVFIYDRQTGETIRVSVVSDGGQGNGDSRYPAISADGRYVAFESYASNLAGGDTNGKGDIFVHDRQTGETTRVSVTSNGEQGNSTSYEASISADGRYVVFESSANNLVSGDTNGTTDVFVHDRQTGETTRVSVASDGGQGNGGSYSPSISADGYHAAFYSVASNLVGGDTNDMVDVFVHDRQTGEITRVSVASNGSEGDGSSYRPSISAAGRYVAFESEASNLVSGDTNDMYDVFVHDRGGPKPPTAVTIAGPTTGFTQTSYIFIATASPVTTTLPITYTWEATGQSPVTNTSGLSDTVTFTWSAIGTQTITVTAMNVVSAVTGTHVITISPVHKLFLPLILRNH